MNYLITGMIPEGWNSHEHLVKFYIWDDSYLFKYYSDQFVSRCVFDHVEMSILCFYHDQAFGGNFSWKTIVAKVLQCGFYWPMLRCL